MLQHKHLIIRAEVTKPLIDETVAEEWIKDIISHIGMKILIGPFSKYLDIAGNRGLTVGAIIETSHVILHSWDECSPAIIQLDLYSCGPLDPLKVFEKLQVFDPIKVEYKFLDRDKQLQIIE
jgi:S-adenosylmethionine/arginine decarboxylase-like enzyme